MHDTATDTEDRNLRPRDILVACVVVWGMVALDVACWRMGFGAGEFLMWGLSLFAMLFLPSYLARRRRIDPDECTVRLWVSWRDLFWGIGAMALLFVPILLGYYVYVTQWAGHVFSFSWSNYAPVAKQIPQEILWQFFCVALPEEYFYRGFVQTNIARLLRNSRQSAVQRFSAPMAIALSALIFAFVHVPNGGFARLVTFFPGCLFGFLRCKTHGIAGAIFAHAMCNLMMFFLNVHNV